MHIVQVAVQPPSSWASMRQCSTSERKIGGFTAVAVKAKSSPGSQAMNSSSTAAPGIFTRRRAPMPSAGPRMSTAFTFGNHSGQRAWSASTAHTASGEAVERAEPWARIGAVAAHSNVCRVVVAIVGGR
jgi:hypothetical protein